MLWGRVVQGLARYEERGDAFPGHDVRCFLGELLLCAVFLALFSSCSAAACGRGDADESCRSAVISISRSSVVCTAVSAARLPRSTIDFCSKAGLGRTCDASAAYCPLISGHRLGIKLD